VEETMKKLRLDELSVTSFETTRDRWDDAGTVHGFQTEPASVIAMACTQTHCTYPIWLCRPHEEEQPEPKESQRRR
jgi:hypothetical protein